MRVVWVTRSFLDYRVPVYQALDNLLANELHVIFSKEFTPERSWKKLESFIGSRAIGLEGERAWGYKGNITGELANSKLRIPYQPGLLKTIKSLQPDVLIGDGFFQWTSGALMQRVRYGTPLVVCYEKTKHTERHAQWYRTLYRKMTMRFIDAMCCNGSQSLEYTVTLGMPVSKITLGNMAADTETLARKASSDEAAEVLRLKDSLGISSGATLLLSVNRLIKLKGLDYLLRAWGAARRLHNSPVVLILVGDGPEKSNLMDLCKHENISDVFFTGAIDYDEIHKYYALADAFVISTLEDNWSLVVPEAMACGLPILCSKYNGCWPELVHEDVNGWVFDPLDLQDTAQCLNKVLTNADRLKEMGEASKRIVAGHTPLHAAQSIYQACEIALNNR